LLSASAVILTEVLANYSCCFSAGYGAKHTTNPMLSQLQGSFQGLDV